MMKDEALEEIWNIRRQIAAECDGDLAARYEFYRQEQEDFIQRGGKLISKPGPRLIEPGESAVIREEPPKT